MARTVFSNGIAFTSRNANTGGGGGDARPFIAYYGRTTFNEIHTADSEGRLVLLLKDGVYYPLSEIGVSSARFYGRAVATSEGVQFANITINSSNTWATVIDIVVPKAILAAIATSGSYDDLRDIPDFARVAFTGSYADLINQPVITSGSIIIDTALSENSPNPVQNKVVTQQLARKDGYYQTLSAGYADKAGDLDIQTSAMVRHTQVKAMDTTGGDKDVKDGAGFVRVVKGTENGITAAGAKIISLGFNLIPSGNGTSFTFRCVKGEWGAYGTSAKNNGYLFTDSQGNILVPSSVKQNGVAVPTHADHGNTYYLPSQDGQCTVVFASAQTNPCAHLCWSNNRDTKDNYEAYNASQVDLASAINAIGGTLRRVGYVFDEINLETKQSIRRIGYRLLNALSWTMEAGPTPEEGEATNTFRAIVSGGVATADTIKAGGAFAIKGLSGLTFNLDGTSLVCDSTIASVADFVTALGNGTIEYELAVEVVASNTLNGQITISDYGIIIFENTAGASVVDIDFDFEQSWNQYIKNSPAKLDVANRVIAEALCNLNKRLSGIEAMIDRGFPSLKVDDLTIARALFTRIALGDAFVAKAGAPTGIPAGVLQFYRNTTDGSIYLSVGSESVSDWIKIK